MSVRLDVLARRIQGVLTRGSDTELTQIAPLDIAQPGDLSFLPDVRLRNRLRNCRASAVIVDRGSVSHCSSEPLIVEDLLIGCARAGEWLLPASRVNRVRRRPRQDYEKVDGSVLLAATATIGQSVTIGPYTNIGPGCVIGDGARIGSYCNLGPNVTIEAASTLGNRVSVGANGCIGGKPFLYIRDAEKWLPLPSFGSVEIGDDVHLGNNVVLDRGAIANTSIGSGTKIDSHVHIGHGVVIGRDNAIAARTAIAGEASIGNGCIIGGAVGIGEGVSIASRVRITAMSMVTKSLTEPDTAYSSGWPARRSRQWWRQVSMLSKRR